MKNLLSLFIFLFSVETFAANVSGKITDESGQPVPFVSVYLKGTTTGTTANKDGAYSLEVKAGECELMFRSIGYKLVSKKIEVKDSPLKVDAILVSESYQLKEATVNASAEDPAYAIIRKAQKQRKHFLTQVESYSCEAYLKSVQRITSYPKKLFGQDVDLGQFVDSTTGIIYLSESVSKLAFKQTHQTKEEMISSKVSGNNRGFSFNQASDILFSFYENLVTIGGLTKRGIVSPISLTAMMYYDYHLEGTFIEGGETINKIKVIPKRSYDPVFTGEIYIMDDSWRIHSLDLFITKEQQLEFIDTFRFKQVYVPVEKNIWLPLNSEFSFVFGAFGFHGNGIIEGDLSNYNLHPDFAPHFFDGEVMKINRDANKKDSAYWEQMRNVPLTPEEKRDYVKRDSTYRVHESKPYRDSIDRKNNKFKPNSFLLTGYDHQNSFKHENFFISGMLNNLQYNTVEGVALNVDARYSKRLSEEEEGRRRISVGGSARYGISNERWNGNVFLSNHYSHEKFSSYLIKCGTDVVQFNSNNPISGILNSSYTLFSQKNFMKIYEKQFLFVQHRTELTNGIFLTLNAEYANRLPLINTDFYSFTKSDKPRFTSNDPLNPTTDLLHFPRNQSFVADARLRIRIKQKYLTRPEGKFVLGTDYPDISFAYRKAFAGVFNSDADYDFASATINDHRRFGLFGGIQYSVTAGKFFNRAKTYFMDYHHFNGNKTSFSSFGLNDFQLLDYYSASTNNEFIEAHGEYNFGGFILNKIPLIRKLKLNEIAGVHYFRTPFVNNYFETSFGLEKLGFIRADFVLGFSENKKVSTGFIFGLKANISGDGITISE